MGKEIWTKEEKAAIRNHFNRLFDTYGISAPIKFTRGNRIYHTYNLVRKLGEPAKAVKHRFIFGAQLGHEIMKEGFYEYKTVHRKMRDVLPIQGAEKDGRALYFVVSHEFAHFLNERNGNREHGVSHGDAFIACYRDTLATVKWRHVSGPYARIDSGPTLADAYKTAAPMPLLAVVNLAADVDGEVTETKRFRVNGRTCVRLKMADGTYRIKVV